MKDAAQKNRLFKHFSAQNWYTQVEVPVFFKGGLDENLKLITDVDVIALRPSRDLRWEIVLGDCKTLKGQSPANRALWMRGLMDHFGATNGVILLKLGSKQFIEPDHKLFASSLGINLLDEREFTTYDRAKVYPGGTNDYSESAADVLEFRSIPKNFPKLKHFGIYLTQMAWNERSYFDLLRKLIGEAKAVSREIDPDKREHLSLVLEATSMFAVCLAACAGLVFNQHLQPSEKIQLENTLKVNIWGGRSQYQFFTKLRKQLVEAKGIEKGTPEKDLTLPCWDDFIQLVRNILESPYLGFSIPQLLRKAALDIFKDRPFLNYSVKSQLSLLKLGMITVRYFCKASAFPTDTVDVLTKLFVDRQSSLVHSEDDDCMDDQKIKEEKSATGYIRNAKNDKHKDVKTPTQNPLPGLNKNK